MRASSPLTYSRLRWKHGVRRAISIPWRAALAAARQMVEGSGVSDDIFSMLKQNLDNEMVVDLLFLISFYCGFVRSTGALEVQVKDSYLSYLEAFPLPGA